MKSLEDKKEYIRQLFPLVDKIEDTSLRDKVFKTFLKAWNESKWDDLESIPVNAETPVKKLTLVQHVNMTTMTALEIAHLVHDNYRLPIDFDILIAGALLHDVSKIVEFEPPKGKEWQPTEISDKVAHPNYGAYLALSMGVPFDVVHVILAHTPLTSTMPSTFEAVIVCYADYCVADVIYLDMGTRLLIAAHKKYRRKSPAYHVED